MGRLEARIRTPRELTNREVAALYALYERYYAGTNAAVFREDLAGKNHLIELVEGGCVRGFSTLALEPFALDGERGLAVFSGDTIIDHEYWGEQALARAFCRYAGRVKGRHPHHGVYWFLISKGYRTYRYLHAFAQHYYPHPHAPTPEPMRRRMEALASRRFGDQFRPQTGIVRFEPPRGHLRPEWCGVRDGLTSRDDVRYFLNSNPGYQRGDELVCIAELSEANLRSVARREFVAGMRERVAAPQS